MINTDSRATYLAHVAQLEHRLSTDEALSNAVGGEFIAVGKLEYYLMRSVGLSDGHLIVDVGCGSGRLACQLAPFPGIRYIGCDVVPRLLSYAEELCQRPDWQFIATSGTTIPCGDAEADFLCFFSVFTHLLHEDTFRYLRDAHRALKPGGLLVLSYLEFCVLSHWSHFIGSVDGLKSDGHHNQFMSQDAIVTWAENLKFDVLHLHRGDTWYIPLPEEIRFESGSKMTGSGSLGQSVAILQKRK